MPSRFVLAITDFSTLGNLETLYRAFAKIDDKKIDLLLIGSKNSYYRQLKRLADKLGLEDRIVRIGSVNKHNFMALYTLSQAFVAPALDDGMGQTLIEAMITGTPAIASASGCHREVADDAALYFKPDDVEQLTQHINTVLNDDAQRSAMINLGKKQAAQFTQQALAQNVMHVYNRARGRE